MNKKSLAGPRALTIIGSLAMLVSLVLPYAMSSNDTMTAFTIAERWKEMQSVANLSFTPYGSYGFGFGVYLFYVAAIAVIAGSIWMIAIKRHNKAAIPNM